MVVEELLPTTPAFSGTSLNVCIADFEATPISTAWSGASAVGVTRMHPPSENTYALLEDIDQRSEAMPNPKPICCSNIGIPFVS
jgi:hypothetical protein